MELIVVIFLLSIMLTFAMPEFSGKIFRDDTETTLNWIIFNVSKFKKQAWHQGKDIFMCIHTDTNTISINGTPPDPDVSDTNILSEFTLPEDVRLDGVEFNSPGQEADTDGCIQFYKNGYSDQAIIHLSDNDGKTFSCFIPAFLHKVTVHEDDIRFE